MSSKSHVAGVNPSFGQKKEELFDPFAKGALDMEKLLA